MIRFSTAPTSVFRACQFLACAVALALGSSQAPGQVPDGLAASDWSSIQAAYQAGRHAVRAQEDGSFAARNPGQKWRTRFDRRGFTVIPDSRDWKWGLQLQAYGFEGAERILADDERSVASHDQGQVFYDWPGGLREWFVNDRRGLEQGWTLTEKPAGAGKLRFTLKTRGGLLPHVEEDGVAVNFVNNTGDAFVTYDKLRAWDADGRTVPTQFESVPHDSTLLRIVIDEQDARYPITIDPIAQQAYLKAANPNPADDFGRAVAISGDTVVVGAPGEDNDATGVNANQNHSGGADKSGAAYVFVRVGLNWTQQAYLKAGNTDAFDFFGGSVAISGDTIVVGAIGEDSDNEGVNGDQEDNDHEYAGAAYVFVRSSGAWSQQAYLKASNTDKYDEFGKAVTVSGDTIVVGAIKEDSAAQGVNGGQTNGNVNSGAAYVFVRSGTTWTQQAYLKSSNSEGPSDPDDPIGDLFGVSVALDADTLVVGAVGEDGPSEGVGGAQGNGSTSAGAAYVFVRTGTTWTQQAYLKASTNDDFSRFARSVAISGDTVVVGSANGEVVAVFIRSGSSWSHQADLQASNFQAADRFGISVAIDGDRIVVGAYHESSSATEIDGDQADDSANRAGAAYAFVRNGTMWIQQAYIKASNSDGADIHNGIWGDHFGGAVAISGDTAVIGAWGEASDGTAPDNNAEVAAGAAYIFSGLGSFPAVSDAYLKPTNTGSDDLFGTSVSIDGDTVVVGAPGEESDSDEINVGQDDDDFSSVGAAYVFVRDDGVWTQEAYLKASNSDENDRFGLSVSISGDTIIVGAHNEDSGANVINGDPGNITTPPNPNFGAAYVFVRSGTTWTQEAYLKPSNPSPFDRFGTAVGISGDTAVVGTPSEDTAGGGTGAAYVFVRTGTTWSEEALLKADTPGILDGLGTTVSISGDSIAVGARNQDDSADNSGAAYVFVRDGAVWTQEAFLKASNPGEGDEFGVSVAIDGDTLVVGAHLEDSAASGVNGYQDDDSAENSGAAYVFVREGTVWTQQAYLKACNTDDKTDRFGTVAISGDAILVGAPREWSNATGVGGDWDDNSAQEAGAAYLYVREGTDWTPRAYLKATNTGASDRFGTVAISGDTMVVGALFEDSSVVGVDATPDDNDAPQSGAAYIFTGLDAPVSILPIEQQGYLKASNREADDNFGVSVAVSGETVVVGANLEDSNAVGVDGDQANNAAPDSGAAYVFVRIDETWIQQAYLKPDPATGFSIGHQFGFSVALSGDTLAVGAPLDNSGGLLNAGAAYVFVRDGGGTWTQQSYLKASNEGAEDRFGFSVGLSGDTLLVGAPLESSNASTIDGDEDNDLASSAGAAYVYQRTGTAWNKEAYLKATNTAAFDNFGVSVALDGDLAVVGASGEDSAADDVDGNEANNDESGSGAAYLFTRSGATWTKSAYLKAGNSEAGDEFGGSVSISGETVVVGARLEDSAASGVNGDEDDNTAMNSGAAYVFALSAGMWHPQAYLKAGNTGAGDQFGRSVSISGDRLIVGARGEASDATGIGGNQLDNSAPEAGAAYLFTRDCAKWMQQKYFKASNTDAGDLFGGAVAISGGVAVVGAMREDSNIVQSDNSVENSGAAYIFSVIPAIAVEYPVGTDLVDGTSAVFFGPAVFGSLIPSKNITVINEGSEDLTDLVVTIDGLHPGDYVVSPLVATSLEPLESTTFAVTFAPTVSGIRLATIHISSAEDVGSFDISLVGTTVTAVEDTDGDTLSDAAEVKLAGLGFDWQVSQPELVHALQQNAELAGLFTQSQIQAMNVSTPLVTKDPFTEQFKLTIGIQKASMLNNFAPFPVTPPQLRTDAQGNIEVWFETQDDAAIFLLESR